jgi:hypothetical protein
MLETVAATPETASALQNLRERLLLERLALPKQADGTADELGGWRSFPCGSRVQPNLVLLLE